MDVRHVLHWIMKVIKSKILANFNIPMTFVDVNRLKTENFNLRLKYRLDNALDHNKHSEIEGNSWFHPRKLPNDSDDVLEELKLLREENGILNEKLKHFNDCESRYVEFDSIKFKFEQMDHIMKNDGRMSDTLQAMLLFNDELVRTNTKSKEKVFDLEIKLQVLKKLCLSNDSQSKYLFNYCMQLKSQLIKDFNESMELSRNLLRDCYECNALKANIETMQQMLIKCIDNNENQSIALSLKDAQIIALEKQIESFRFEPNVTQEQQNEYTKIIQRLSTNIVEKDRIIKYLTRKNKEVIENYTDQIVRKDIKVIEFVDNDLYEQNLMMRSICEVLSDAISSSSNFLGEVENNCQDRLIELVVKTTDTTNKNKNSVIERWSLLVEIIREVCQYFTKSIVKDGSRNSVNESAGTRASIRGLALRNILVNKCHEEIPSDSCEVSYLGVENDIMDTNSDLYRPQYKLKKDFENLTFEEKPVSDKFPFIYLSTDAHNDSIFQSFTEDQHCSNSFTTPTFESMQNKIGESADIAYQYTNSADGIANEDPVPKVKSDNNVDM